MSSRSCCVPFHCVHQDLPPPRQCLCTSSQPPLPASTVLPRILRLARIGVPFLRSIYAPLEPLTWTRAEPPYRGESETITETVNTETLNYLVSTRGLGDDERTTRRLTSRLTSRLTCRLAHLNRLARSNRKLYTAMTPPRKLELMLWQTQPTELAKKHTCGLFVLLSV